MFTFSRLLCDCVMCSYSSRYLQQKRSSNILREIASYLPCDFTISQMSRSGSSLAAALCEVRFQVLGAHARLSRLLMLLPEDPYSSVSLMEGVSLLLVVAGTRIGGSMIFNLNCTKPSYLWRDCATAATVGHYTIKCV